MMQAHNGWRVSVRGGTQQHAYLTPDRSSVFYLQMWQHLQRQCVGDRQPQGWLGAHVQGSKRSSADAGQQPEQAVGRGMDRWERCQQHVIC